MVVTTGVQGHTTEARDAAKYPAMHVCTARMYPAPDVSNVEVEKSSQSVSHRGQLPVYKFQLVAH